MASSQSTMDFLLDQLSGCGPVSSRRMFGEFCVYYDGRPVGLVCGDQLYLKPTDIGRKLMREVREQAPFPGANLHLLVTADDWDDRQWLGQLVRATFEALPPPKPVKPRVAKMPSGARAKTAASLNLPNLGPRSREMLMDAGIGSFEALQKMGAVAAYVKVRRKNARASLNLLWALEGALSSLPWQEVAKQHRTSLLLALEQAEKAAAKVPASAAAKVTSKVTAKRPGKAAAKAPAKVSKRRT